MTRMILDFRKGYLNACRHYGKENNIEKWQSRNGGYLHYFASARAWSDSAFQ